jgi:hypothetical protein
MAATNVPHCQKCSRRNVVNFRVEPEEAFKMVVLNRWREICPSCFIRRLSELVCGIRRGGCVLE